VDEHITLVAEPGSEYLYHATPKTGKSSEISKIITDKLAGNGQNL